MEPTAVMSPPAEVVVHSQIELPLFQASTWPLEQPPNSLIPADVDYIPEFDDNVVVVPVVVASTAMSSVLTVIPFPAPTLTVNAPLVPPPVKPDPAVTPVVAYVPTFIESTRTPPLASRSASSPDSKVTPPTVTVFDPSASAVVT